MAYPRKLKIVPTTLPTIEGNASTVFPTNLFSVFANLSNHFSRPPHLLEEKLLSVHLPQSHL